MAATIASALGSVQDLNSRFGIQTALSATIASALGSVQYMNSMFGIQTRS